MDRDELKATFHRVNAYRHVCRAVRGTANRTLFNGCLFAVIAYWIMSVTGPSSIIFLVLAFTAALEIGVGLWKKIAPSVECVLVDSFTNALFGVSILARFAMAQQGMMRSPPLYSLFFALWSLYDAWQQFGAYRQLRAAFVQRPSRAQMSYVAEMIREIHDSAPEEDPTCLDLPTSPPIKAQLADELAFLVDQDSGDAVAVDRDALHIERLAPTESRPPLGRVILEGTPFHPVPLSDANWRNYLRWKGETPAG